MRCNGQEVVIDQCFIVISIFCIEYCMVCIMDYFFVFIVICNQYIDLVVGIIVIGMIKDKNVFVKIKFYFCCIGDKFGICCCFIVSSINVQCFYSRFKNI